MWVAAGKGWLRVEAALNGLWAPHARPPPLALRITRAALVCRVCEKDGARYCHMADAWLHGCMGARIAA